MKSFKIDQLKVEIYPDRKTMGKAAARQATDKMKQYIAEKGEVRVVFAAAPSQDDFYEALCGDKELDWSKVVAFTQDEYLGASVEDSYSLINYIKPRLFDKVNPGVVHFIDGSCKNIEEECRRYGALITEKQNDITCIGIGDNGHIAFNEPHEADFNDPRAIKVITVDERCKAQQVDNFGFAAAETVPPQGITLTIPPIMNSKCVFCIVPTERKAEAVKKTLEGAVAEECPASVLRLHECAVLFLETNSAKELG